VLWRLRKRSSMQVRVLPAVEEAATVVITGRSHLGASTARQSLPISRTRSGIGLAATELTMCLIARLMGPSRMLTKRLAGSAPSYGAVSAFSQARRSSTALFRTATQSEPAGTEGDGFGTVTVMVAWALGPPFRLTVCPVKATSVEVPA
jgi:hypothetical protein